MSITNSDKIREDLLDTVQSVNRELLAYKKISRVRILEEPMEMTTTQKIKRPRVMEWLKTRQEAVISI